MHPWAIDHLHHVKASPNRYSKVGGQNAPEPPHGSANMAELLAFAGLSGTQRYRLTEELYVLGRHPDCDIVLDAGAVSRQHAKIIRADNKFFVEDLHSRNGTFLNGRPVQGRCKLANGDQLKICDLMFTFQAEVETESAIEGEQASSAPLLVEESQPPSSSTILSKVDLSSSQMGARLTVSPQARLQALLEIAGNLGKALAVDQVLPKVLDSLFKIFVQADRGIIALKESVHGDLVPKGVRHRDQQAQDTIRLSRTIVNEVLTCKEAVLSADAASDSRFDMSQSIADFRIRSLMCAPLVSPDGDVLGVIQIDTLNQRNRFQREDLEVLASVATQVAIAVENAQLHEGMLRQKALERDLELAHHVQRGLLPVTSPSVSGYEFFDFYEPANQVGGDYFDYIQLPAGRWAIVLADVSGKGVAAALVMAKLAGDVRYCLASEKCPASALRRINDGFAHSGWQDRFVTMVLAVLDPREEEVTIVNAGHMPPVVRHADGSIEEFGEEIAGIPLGIHDGFDYEQTTRPLHPGDAMILFTDGISESMNESGELYGLGRLRTQIAQASSSAGAASLGHAILNDVKMFAGKRSQSDDMCLACLGRQPT